MQYSRDYKQKNINFRSKLRPQVSETTIVCTWESVTSLPPSLPPSLHPSLPPSPSFLLPPHQHQIPKYFKLPVHRNNIFETTYNGIMNVRDPEVLKARLYVVFHEEVGLDYGGLARSGGGVASLQM